MGMLLVRVAEELGRDPFAPSGGQGASAARRPLGAGRRRRVRAFLDRSAVGEPWHLANRPERMTPSALRGHPPGCAW